MLIFKYNFQYAMSNKTTYYPHHIFINSLTSHSMSYNLPDKSRCVSADPAAWACTNALKRDGAAAVLLSVSLLFVPLLL